jgi:hypothetical protein
MAELKTDKICLKNDFQIPFGDGWTLIIDRDCTPTTYTLTHGKKSITFDSHVMRKLCSRQYGIRLVKGRKQMNVPAHVLQNFVDYSVFLDWYDPNFLDENIDQSNDISMT